MALSRSKLLIIFIILLVGSGIWIGARQNQIETKEPKVDLTPILSHKNGQIRAELALTLEAQERGLSGRESLAPDQGMLFIFPEDEIHFFWMKDMNFPLDIIWLDKDGRILGIADNVATSTFPNTIPSPGAIRQVLEVNAGYTQKYGLSIGDFIR